MALDITVGGTTSNSYVAQATADDFFNNHYSIAKSSLWSTLNSAQKESVLKRACQVLDSLRVLDTELGSGALPIALVQRDTYDLTIHRLDVGQVLNFPRNIDLLDGTYTGYIPQEVQDAQCEQAIYLLAFDDSSMSTRMSGVTQETIGAGNVRTHTVFKEGGTFIAPLVLELMRPYLRPTKKVRRA